MENKNVFRQRFTKIEGLSSIRRLPRLGKIRLGIKLESKTKKDRQGNPVTYPKETEYFVCPPEIRKVYGEEPTELNIVFPVNDPEVIFPQCYKWYGSSKGLKCRGDGVNALRLNEDTGEMEERTCPCDLLENGKCKQRASLIFMMPGIKIGGVYQVDLSSYHSIVDINSGIDYARALVGDRIVFLPFKLKRVPKETHNEGKKQIHYTLQLELDITAKELTKIQEGQKLFAGQNKRYEIEAPKPEDDFNPALGNGEVIEDDDLEETDRELEERVGKKTAEEITKEREAKEAEQAQARQEALIKENEEINAQQAKLKKEIKEGEHKLKSYQEAKAIHKKKQEVSTVIADPATTEQLVEIRDIIKSSLLKEEEYFKLGDLIKKGMSKEEAIMFLAWWLKVEPLRKKEKEKQANATKEEKMKQAREIVKTGGKLERISDGEIDAPFPDDIKNKGSKGEDFIGR